MCRVATRFARRFLQFTMLLPSFFEKNEPYLYSEEHQIYLVLPYKPNISLIHSILYNKLFAYIYKFLYLYIIILADIYA